MEITRIENIKTTTDTQALDASQPIKRSQGLENEELTRSIAATSLANVMPAFTPGVPLSVVTPLREQPVSALESRYGGKYPRPVAKGGLQNNKSESSFDMVA